MTKFLFAAAALAALVAGADMAQASRVGAPETKATSQTDSSAPAIQEAREGGCRRRCGA